MTAIGKPICFGADRRWLTLPISNLPSDTIRVRRRIRSRDAAKAYIRTPGAIQCWVLVPDGPDSVKLGWMTGGNSIIK